MNVALLDIGTGNLRTLAGALERGGARVRVEADPAAALGADAIVLPGAGTWTAAAARLEPHAQSFRAALAAGLPCLGVGLGMQLLFEAHEEATGRGLGVLPGVVRGLRALRVPHTGWNRVEADDDPLLAGLLSFHCWFAHDSVVAAGDATDVIAWARCGDDRFPAAVHRGATWGVLFHPEKSLAPGLRLIANFLALAAPAARSRQRQPVAAT